MNADDHTPTNDRQRETCLRSVPGSRWLRPAGKPCRLAASFTALAVTAAVFVQGCSAYHVSRARAARAGLGDSLYVEDFGPSTGDATIFLPGMMGTTTYWRMAGAPSLASATTRVILVDELGFGRSPWPESEYTLEDHLSALERTLVGRVSSRNLTLVGHSFGSMLAVEFAARHADSVRRVILFGTPVYRSTDEAIERIGQMSALAGLTARHRWAARLICLLHNAFMPVAARLAPLARRDVPPAVARDGALHFWPSLRGSVENVVLRHSIEPAALLLGGRVTFVHGRRDLITPVARIREVARASGAHAVETDDDHLSYWQNAARLVDEITAGDEKRQ